MSNELCRFIGRLKSYEKRLHYLICIAEGKILETVSLVTAYTSALAAADDMECVNTARFACDQFIEVHSELVCDLIDDAYGKITVFFIACILFCSKSQLLCKLFLCIVTYLTKVISLIVSIA